MEEFSTQMQTNRQEARASLAAMAAEEDSNATFHLILGNFAYQERNLQEGGPALPGGHKENTRIS